MGGATGVILAAGQGKRMRSHRPKVVFPVAGVPMVRLVLEALRAAGVERCVAVVGREAGPVRAVLGERVTYAVQEEPRGTGHALLQARPCVPPDDDLVVLCGDTPLLTGDILRDLLARHRATGAAATVLTAELPDPTGYGRVLRDAGGRVERIVEEADADAAVRAVREVNTGIYCFRAPAVFAALEEVRPDNRQGEYYLVDVLPLLRRRGLPVEAVQVADPEAVRGINTRAELAAAEAVLRRRTLARLWAGGTTVAAPESVSLDVRVEAGPDTVLGPGTVLEGPVRLGSGCRVGPGTWIRVRGGEAGGAP